MKSGSHGQRPQGSGWRVDNKITEQALKHNTLKIQMIKHGNI